MPPPASLEPLPVATDLPSDHRAKPSLASARAALTVAVAFVSSGAIFARLADSPPLTTAAWRMTIATACISLVLLRGWREWRRLTWREYALGATAGLFLAAHFATWISSINRTTVASSVVLVNTTPLWVALLSPLLTGERTSRLACIGIGLSFVGAVIIAGSDLRIGGAALIGDLLALTGAVCASLYLLIGRRLRVRLSLAGYCTLTYANATVVLWLVVATAGVNATGFSIRTWGAIAGMALLAQLGGHTIYNWSLKHLSTSAVAVAMLGEPIGSSLLAWRIFGEVPPPGSFAGAIIVLFGIYLATTQPRRC